MLKTAVLQANKALSAEGHAVVGFPPEQLKAEC